MATTSPHSHPVLTPDPAATTSDPARALLAGLRGHGHARDTALRDLHALLIRGAYFELRRRRALLLGISPTEIDDLAHQAADDALLAIIGKLDTFRGQSRFTTWAYKFVILEAGVKARRRAWRDREITLDDEGWRRVCDPGGDAQRSAETGELLRAIAAAIDGELTERQRTVFIALALNEIPIDVLAQRMDSTRGALYKTLHDARGKLRRHLAAAGFELTTTIGIE